MCLDIAKSLEFLHSEGITHGNLTPDSIFVTHDYSIRLGGFGWTKLLPGVVELSSSGPKVSGQNNPFIWIAPEVLLGGSSDPSADLYSLGVILYWILSLKFPYSTSPSELLSSGQVASPTAMLHPPMVLYTRIIFNNLRPDIPPHFAEDISRLLCDLWDSDSSARPSILDVIRRLQ
eukprot:TRINITY_DN4279_c0_g2_i3.p1 TRINITY_DN4279_c0_g2~~TRINITY_DN4279_c0_g2_i3.p1  ORF type:complete len:176 (+),score=27.37 TRINITY_DN4279_c0_g2_i3:352-879(+)